MRVCNGRKVPGELHDREAAAPAERGDDIKDSDIDPLALEMGSNIHKHHDDVHGIEGLVQLQGSDIQSFQDIVHSGGVHPPKELAKLCGCQELIFLHLLRLGIQLRVWTVVSGQDGLKYLGVFSLLFFWGVLRCWNTRRAGRCPTATSHAISIST